MRQRNVPFFVLALLVAVCLSDRCLAERPATVTTSKASAFSDDIQQTLTDAGDNRAELEAALEKVPADEIAGMKFLIANMPERDARTLSADFLLQNVSLGYKARKEAPWGAQIPDEIFLNAVLPYVSINESRDNWRKSFRKRFLPLVSGAQTPAEAAAMLNQKIFPLLKVKYSTKRRRADQGPFQSMESGLASCTGLSILLIDACRSVGVPARFVGTPLWSDGSGNHSWVEVWDGGWHFTGAAEPTGNELDKAWFVNRASQADGNDARHAIYAVSFRKTPLTFPLVWDRSINYVSSVNVTARYVQRAEALPEGQLHVMFVAIDSNTTERVPMRVVVTNEDGEVVFDAESHDKRFDRNDHITAALPANQSYVATFSQGATILRQPFQLETDGQLVRADLE